MQFPILPKNNSLYNQNEYDFILSSWLEKALNFYSQKSYTFDSICSFLQWMPRYDLELNDDSLIYNATTQLILDMILKKFEKLFFENPEVSILTSSTIFLNKINLQFVLNLCLLFHRKICQAKNETLLRNYKTVIFNIFLKKKNLVTDLSQYLENSLFETVNQEIKGNQDIENVDYLLIDALLGVCYLLEALPETGFYSESSNYNGVDF